MKYSGHPISVSVFTRTSALCCSNLTSLSVAFKFQYRHYRSTGRDIEICVRMNALTPLSPVENKATSWYALLVYKHCQIDLESTVLVTWASAHWELDPTDDFLILHRAFHWKVAIACGWRGSLFMLGPFPGTQCSYLSNRHLNIKFAYISRQLRVCVSVIFVIWKWHSMVVLG